jgi:hypothetical protein
MGLQTVIRNKHRDKNCIVASENLHPIELFLQQTPTKGF